MERTPRRFVFRDLNRRDSQGGATFAVHIDGSGTYFCPAFHWWFEGNLMDLAILCAEGHGGKLDVGHCHASTSPWRNIEVMLEVEGEGVGVVFVHVFDNTFLHGCFLSCRVRHCDF